MRIAALFAHHKLDRGWSTPISLINALIRLGHRVTWYNLYKLDKKGRSLGYTDEGLKAFIDEQTYYDLLLHFDYGQFYSPLFNYVMIPKIAELGDDPQAFNGNFAKATMFDLCLTPDYPSLEKYRQNAINAYWFTHWADSTIHKSLDTQPDKFLVTTVDEARGDGLIQKLRKEFPKDFLDERYFYAEEHTKFMARGHAVLQRSQWGEITRRPFEAAACGKLIFADRLAPERLFENIFEDGESIVFYDNFDDLVGKIRYFSMNLDETRRIARNGQRVVLEGHTADHRAKELISHFDRIA